MNQVISAADAKAAGLKHYFTGKPCANGLVSPRRVSDRHCTCELCSSSKTSRSRRRKQNTYKSDPEYFKEKRKAWVAANPERNKSNKKAWRDANRAAMRSYDQTRRSRFSEATPTWFGELDAFLIQEAAQLCCEREELTGFPWHIDHMVPLQSKLACGLHCASNLQVIPATMNIRKHNKMILCNPGDWIGDL